MRKCSLRMHFHQWLSKQFFIISLILMQQGLFCSSKFKRITNCLPCKPHQILLHLTCYQRKNCSWQLLYYSNQIARTPQLKSHLHLHNTDRSSIEFLRILLSNIGRAHNRKYTVLFQLEKISNVLYHLFLARKLCFFWPFFSGN